MEWGRGKLAGARLAVAVFAVYAAPIVLSGEATWAGYITLDDTSTWLAMTDRVLEHGRSLDGLAPSSYEAALDSYLDQSGYPVGAFLPLGVAGELLGTDIAWLFQPTIAFAAAMLALGLYALAGQLVRSRWLSAGAAFVAAQPALLFGYAMWSGIKEVTAAALVALAAALLPDRGPRARSPRAAPAARRRGGGRARRAERRRHRVARRRARLRRGRGGPRRRARDGSQRGLADRARRGALRSRRS